MTQDPEVSKVMRGRATLEIIVECSLLLPRFAPLLLLKLAATACTMTFHSRGPRARASNSALAIARSKLGDLESHLTPPCPLLSVVCIMVVCVQYWTIS